jgi:glycosyltransferase involved in cell wall biosynthesis
MSSPLVSAVIPVFNGEEFVADAIESVLSQTHPNVECIVVNDGSFDGTEQVVDRFQGRIRHVRRENRGVSAARNEGARLARGELLAFLDADDVWINRRLERMIAAAGCKLAVLCASEVVDQHLRPLGVIEMTPHATPETMLMQSGSTVSCSSNLLVDTAYFREMGGFSEDLSMSADWDLLLRMLESGPVVYLAEPLVRYRRHAGNMSRNLGAMESDMRLAYRRAFARRQRPSRFRREAMGRLYWMLSGSYAHAGLWRSCARTLGKAMLRSPRTVTSRVFSRRPGLPGSGPRVGDA